MLKKKYLIIMLLLISLLLYSSRLFIKKDILLKVDITKENKDIQKYYHDKVKVRKDTDLYCLDENKYSKCGNIGKDMEIELDIYDKENTSYFKLKDKPYYIFYKDVSAIEAITNINPNIEKYIPFPETIVMERTILYKEDGLAYNLKEPLSSPVLKVDGDKKYVAYNGQLYFVKQEDIKEIVTSIVTEPSAQKITVLNYHFFYDEQQSCEEIICLKKSVFEDQMKYLYDNEYYTPTMQEFEWFLDKKINLPQKSVLITVDDGALGTDTILPEILEKYNLHATLFLITGWNDKNKFISSHIELHSHSDAMHEAGVCPGGQGGGIKCLPEETVLSDLKKTRELLNETTAFAYPFYEYNDRAIRLLQEAGFTMAFVGGRKKAYPGINKMLIPRYSIVSTYTMQEFIQMVSP